MKQAISKHMIKKKTIESKGTVRRMDRDAQEVEGRDMEGDFDWDGMRQEASRTMIEEEGQLSAFSASELAGFHTASGSKSLLVQSND